MLGTLGLWCPDFDTTIREGNLHSVQISALSWSPNGNRLITGDLEGNIVGWKVDNRGKLSTVAQYRLRGPIRHITFKFDSTKSKENK